MDTVEHRTVSIYDLIPHERNYNKHPQEQIERVKASLRRFSQVDDAIVKALPDGRYKIVAHECVTTSALQLLEAGECLHLAQWNVTIVPDHWTELDVEGYMAASNETARLSNPDQEELATLLQEQKDAGYLLESLGSSDESLRQMLEALSDEYIGGSEERDEEEDELPEEVETRARIGDVWQLGRHRLYVGDCTDVEAVKRLMKGDKAIAIITDPPYGEIKAQWDKANLHFVSLLGQFVKEHATVVLFCSLPFGFDMHRKFLESGYCWRWDAVWAKVLGGFRISDYMPRVAHEHIFAYAFKGTAISDLIFNGWDAGENGEPYFRTNANKIGDTRDVYSKRSLTYAEGQEDGKRWLRSVLEGKEKTVMPHAERTVHPTQKPLEVITKLITLLSHADDLVYDPFLGSGTTLIACEDLGRRCVGCELEPKHADIILTRYEQHTGQTATLLQRATEAEHV